MSALRTCEAHGPFDAGVCPDCGARGRLVLDADRRERLSRFLSGALRHFPSDLGLSMDDAGRVRYAALVRAATDRYEWATPEAVEAVVATDPKGRFERADGRIRAAYGHSVDVDLGSGTDGGAVPDRLYHGTAPRNVGSIREEGLKPMGRQEVHLSPTREGARSVGRRHAAEPIVFVVDSEAMLSDGLPIRRRGPETYTADRVPPRYLGL
ncbi:RNA 2'-phosphotransferase [Halegenticoccus soli]|uniref:RNA 2'-phosphotransferase n=1 Tax=Halegenticoccus soli TaxID=1985678 RepID=UPI000C6E4D6F|nr:RNA 2'-phosphotransferase [Halegenticoccus soli]